MEPILYETVDYHKVARRKKRRRYWLVAILTVATIVVVAYAVLLLPLLLRDNNSPINSWQDKNVPLYTNQSFQTRTNYTLHDPKTQKSTFYFEKRVYSSPDREQQVKAYFTQQLPAAGWTIVKSEPPGGLESNNGLTAVTVTLKRGKNQNLTLEIGVLGQRTMISFNYQETLS